MKVEDEDRGSRYEMKIGDEYRRWRSRSKIKVEDGDEDENENAYRR